MTTGIQELMRAIERLWDTYCHDVLVAGDVDAALAATAAETTLVNVPAMTGAGDRDGLRRYLERDLVPHRPADLTRKLLSRTVDRFRVVDETAVSFTHDRELPWLLPGAGPTHRSAEVLAISVVTVRQGRITAQRALWDHAGLLAQLGLDAAAVTLGATPVPAADRPAGWW